MAEEVQRVLDAVDGVAEADSPTARAKQLTHLLDAVPERIRQARQQAVREMHESGMTYREIAAELDISFGRVRQILEGVNAPRKPRKKPADDK
ncbi:sigma factor-like helix-turn-helix DNA-binding protein [Streptomyces sp. DSM 42041]|uniref:Sigma factor-like helix-turn-helix DNA-binding protein n=1 Tax=Streptomyces hazeniae TaxID=3075538 RepID=A0ABU2NWP2_9ACTN|nr:helix-turn-helix domain-containing protein [Streptomyces sp. DSM 42041]MDT0381404.1 sigma factor-like helix-turn-helix DNA-binding protein [Streptomyces sp. DSM 42041]